MGQFFNAIEDPRCSGKIEHRLVEVLVIAVCAVIACAESWNDIALYGRSKLAWLRTFLELANGIPSHDTFRRVFMLIDPDAFEAGFAAWVGSLTASFEREVVAIDGKTIRRSFDHGREQSALHVVSAWASEQGLVLGQRCVDGKSNEITAVPELLDQLALENSIGTVAKLGVRRPVGYFRVRSLTEGGCVAWVLRLVEIGAEGEGSCADIMEIRGSDDLVDIANLGLTLAEAKRLLAGVQREIVAAQAGSHAVRRPECPRCGGVSREGLPRPCGVDAFRPGHGATSPLSLCRVWRDRGWPRLALALPIDPGAGPASGASLRPDDLQDRR